MNQEKKVGDLVKSEMRPMVYDVQTWLDKNLETFNAIEKNIQANIDKVFAEQAELEKMI